MPKVHVTPNALDPAYFIDGANRYDRFIYASSPSRGLHEVLKVWPSIRSRLLAVDAVRFRDIRLDVYYGFTPKFVEWGRSNIDDFPNWLAEMKRLLKDTEGVNYIGLVDHTQLATAYAGAGFSLYPTSFPETGCVSLMKAQAMGAVPVTSRYEDSTLPELTGQFDLGPRGRPGQISQDAAWLHEWEDAVVDAAEKDMKGQLAPHRSMMIRRSRERFLWRTVAGLWHEAFNHALGR